MAENKKAFIVYTDWKQYVDDLNNEQVGLWTRWMFDYCNDKWLDKEIEYPKDVAVKVLCKLTKDILKRDLKKYEEKKTRIDKINQRKREQVETKSKQTRNDIDNEIVNEIDHSNKLLVNSNKLLEDTKVSNNIVSKDTCGEVSKNKPQPLLTLPCLKGYNHPIYEEDIEYYKNLYPAVDILQELKKMIGWLESNPSNRKTKNGIKAFITRWLSKVQDKVPKQATIGFGEHDIIKRTLDDVGFDGFQQLGETDAEYEARKKKYEAQRFGGNVL